jgi:hypothetical protein
MVEILQALYFPPLSYKDAFGAGAENKALNPPEY